jgi:hypothetical protein
VLDGGGHLRAPVDLTPGKSDPQSKVVSVHKHHAMEKYGVDTTYKAPRILNLSDKWTRWKVRTVNLNYDCLRPNLLVIHDGLSISLDELLPL